MQNQICLLIFVIHSISSFNLSPTPNIVITEKDAFSKYKNFIKQNRSSYFGFSINLRKSHVIISAPRAQPIVKEQENTEEPGAIFKCNFSKNLTVESCRDYIFDTSAESNSTRLHENRKVIDSESKDFQLLGFAMDGGGSDNNKFVVCAPHLKAFSEKPKPNETANFYMNGLCSWLPETTSRVPENYTKIAPLRFFDQQNLRDGKISIYNYQFAESGFSVHVTENDENVIIGCPGIYNWKGSIIFKSLKRKRQDFYGTNNIDYIADVYSHINKTPIVGYSYLGYAVSSANFLGTDQIFYIASAPRVNHIGMIYIFEIKSDAQVTKKFLIRGKKNGSKYGEYFGYAVLCEDFNSDGLPDIAVSAPFYTKDGIHENGAVHIFINKGNFKFDEKTVLQSNNKGSGRFGMSISKIGDINLDGYNDLLVSEPFENGGTVYIFLGTPLGLSSTPSQIIQAPKINLQTKPMFGFGLSRGVDIDGNGYNDVAIGDPNSEVVYIYRSYPIIRINSILNFSKSELKIDTKTLNVSFCAKFLSKSKINSIKISTILTLDPILKRVSVQENGLNKTLVNKTITLSKIDKCITYELTIHASLAVIFTPVELKLDFDLVDKIQENSSKFCETCVLLDPKDRKTLKNEIAFSTGCNSSDCKVELSVFGILQNVSQPFILGSKKTITVNYVIKNTGEPAYSTKLTIKMSSNLTQFSRLPTSCTIEQNVLSCDIHNKKPFFNQTVFNLSIVIDMTTIDEKFLEIEADISSIGSETNPQDNLSIVKIDLAEFSKIRVSSSSTPELHISDTNAQTNTTFRYQIFNYGPSNIKELKVTLQIPVLYALNSNNFVKTIDIDDSSFKIFYKGKSLEIKLTNYEKILNLSNENSEKRKEFNDFDRSELGYDYEMNHQDLVPESPQMKKRSVDYNKNLSLVNESQQILYNNSTKYNTDLEKLEKNQTIAFDCTQQDNANGCIEAEFFVEDFQPDNEPVTINFNFSFNFDEFDKIFSKSKGIFIYKTNIELLRSGNDNSTQSLNVTLKNPHAVIYKKVIVKVPLEVYIMSGIIGILVFILILWGLKNCGFFERKKKVELKRLIRESQALSARQLQDWMKEYKQMQYQ